MITTSARRIAAVLAACLMAALPAAATAASAATAAVTAGAGAMTAAASLPVAGLPATGPGDGGQRRTTFGVQPSAAKKPDARPNFSYAVTPGAAVKDHIAVLNYADEPLTLRVYAGDAFTTADGGFDLYAANHRPTDVGSWVKLGRNLLRVPARSRAIIPFTLTVPRNVTPGDHTGGIVASLAATRTDKQGNKVAVDQRVGARIYLRVAGELAPRLAVEDLTTTYHGTANPFARGSATVTYTVRNSGNVRLAARQAVGVRDLFGGRALVGKLPAVTELLPGATLKITASATGVVPAVRGTTTVTVDPEPVRGDIKYRVLPRVTRTEAFSAVPWTLLGVLLVAAATAAVKLVRRHRRRGPRPGESRRRGPGTAPKRAVGVAALALTAAVVAAGSPHQARAAETAGRALARGTAPLAVTPAGGGLAVTPGQGSDTQPITLTAAAPCPATTTNVIARVTGTGFPRGGQIVVGNAPLATYPTTAGGGPAIPLTYTMRDYASTAGFTALRGTYTFTVSCLKGAFGLTGLRDFTGSLRFTAKDAYRDGTRAAAVEGPARGAQAPGPTEQPVPPTVSGGGTGADAPGSGGPSAPAGGSGTPAGVPAAAADAAAAQGSDTSLVAWSVIGFAVGLLALLTGVAQWVRGRRARAADIPGQAD